jgi:hypothetical protein
MHADLATATATASIEPAHGALPAATSLVAAAVAALAWPDHAER